MRLSVKSDYAARAVLWLARRYPDGMAHRIEEMAVAQGIPANYLVQILLELKAKQIVKSQRGKDGGYLLARPPGEISFAEVLRAMHGDIFETPALADRQCPPELRAAWQKLQRALDEAGDGISFQQLLEAGDEKEKMYYI